MILFSFTPFLIDHSTFPFSSMPHLLNVLMDLMIFSTTFSVPMKSSTKETHFLDGALSSPANNIFSFLLNVTEYMFNLTVTSEALGDELAVIAPVKHFLLDL